jgi:hypothetical protein
MRCRTITPQGLQYGLEGRMDRRGLAACKKRAGRWLHADRRRCRRRSTHPAPAVVAIVEPSASPAVPLPRSAVGHSVLCLTTADRLHGRLRGLPQRRMVAEAVAFRAPVPCPVVTWSPGTTARPRAPRSRGRHRGGVAWPTAAGGVQPQRESRPRFRSALPGAQLLGEVAEGDHVPRLPVGMAGHRPYRTWPSGWGTSPHSRAVGATTAHARFGGDLGHRLVEHDVQVAVAWRACAEARSGRPARAACRGSESGRSGRARRWPRRSRR